jgi:hypothetical protein
MTSVDLMTEIQLFRAAAGDDALDFVVTDLHDDVGHDGPELQILDLSRELIAC